MNPIDHLESTCKDEKVSEPGDLLDESWFFGNLLHCKPRMSRCYSDPCPCPSSNYTEEMFAGKSLEESFSSLQKLPAEGQNLPRPAAGLVRTPSLPEESSSQAKRRSHRLRRGNNSTAQAPLNSLSRAPSLPSSIEREEIQDEESDFSMSRLIRQASLKHPDVLPPRHLPKGGVRGSSSTPRHCPRRKPDIECLIPESPEGMIRRQNPISRSKLTKSSSDLAFQELQYLRDLSIKFDKTESEINKGNEFAGLQENKQTSREEKMRRSSSSETWQAQNQSLDNSKRSVEDMKAQIRFWARAVASNVRQEC